MIVFKFLSSRQRYLNPYKTQDKTKARKKEKEEKPNDSGNSSTDTPPQTQDKQKPENKSKKEEQKEGPEYLLKQLEEIQKDYEKAKVKDEEFKKLNYSDELEQWFGDI
ncbi:hypothetical protein HYD98_01965 [Mycoplasmopsis bovis]|nr:hypothetical protein [Mycoplasmopsis bovis]QQH29252.1 hypothetical protein HYD98_01965 [Mycoplasmopsis bovis]